MKSGRLNIGLYLNNLSDKENVIDQIQNNNFPGNYLEFNSGKIAIFSSVTINRLIEDEIRHDHFVVFTEKNKGLHTMSSGERKQALLKYLLSQKPEYLVLDDIYSNLDLHAQEAITRQLSQLGNSTTLIQIFYRKNDLLPEIHTVLTLDEKNRIIREQTAAEFLSTQPAYQNKTIHNKLPEPDKDLHIPVEILVEMRSVSARYGEKQVLDNINWQVKKNEFWQLRGPNGAGKSTLVSMITGDNPFGYGQELFLFGRKKGSGESIWDIKNKIGYFSPSMIQRFYHNDTVENMIISGFRDSVGLYSKPGGYQQSIARQWLSLLDMEPQQKFLHLSPGLQRMVMVARAMVKHPPLLILDEPTIELDDRNSELFVNLIHKIIEENNTAVIYISHRPENNLQPAKIFELVPAERGFTGRIIK